MLVGGVRGLRGFLEVAGGRVIYCGVWVFWRGVSVWRRWVFLGSGFDVGFVGFGRGLGRGVWFFVGCGRRIGRFFYSSRRVRRSWLSCWRIGSVVVVLVLVGVFVVWFSRIGSL